MISLEYQKDRVVNVNTESGIVSVLHAECIQVFWTKIQYYAQLRYAQGYMIQNLMTCQFQDHS